MYWCDFLEGATGCCRDGAASSPLHPESSDANRLQGAASRVYECSLTGPMLLQSVGQAAGKARGGDELTPVLIREQRLSWWLYWEKDGSLAWFGSLISM